MLITLDRSTSKTGAQRTIWGRHNGKVWTAVRGGCATGRPCNVDAVYGMTLSTVTRYPAYGAYLQFFVEQQNVRTRWVDIADAILPDFEQHMVFAPGAVWLWLKLGECDNEYLVPNSDLFHLIPTSQQLMAWSQPWQTMAAVMCKSLAAAVIRDEYVQEM